MKKTSFNSDIRLRSERVLKKRLMGIAKKRQTSMSKLVRDVLGAACTLEEQRASVTDPTAEQVLIGEVEKSNKPGTERISRFEHRQE